MNSLIFQYIKRQKKIVGLLVGVKVGGRVSIAWSLCNKKDDFNINAAFSYCFRRLFNTETIPFSIRKDVEKFKKRCVAYFSGPFSPDVEIVNFPTHTRFNLKDYYSLIPEDVKNRWGLTLPHMYGQSLIRAKMGETINKGLSMGVLYATELETTLNSQMEELFPGCVINSPNGAVEMTFRGVTKEKPKTKSSYIRIHWSIIEDGKNVG